MELSLEFNKDDVAAIVIAEAEKKMRLTIKDLKSSIVKTDLLIDDANDKFIQIGENLIKTNLADKLKTIRSGIKATKIKELSVDLNMSINSHKNSCTISISTTTPQGSNKIGIKIESKSFDITAAQKTLQTKLEKLENNKTDLINETIKWRKKLSDMPMLERQVKAALAKRQVEKMAGGTQMVKALINNLDSTVKLLGD